LIQRTQPDAESDTALLARFASVRDEAAFEELMRRHGPMVLGVCARMLRQQQDAEDALQAVFLIVASRARALRRVRSVAGWLHNVAVRISLNALKMKRRREEGLRRLQRDRSEPDRDETHDLRDLLDEELAQLPAQLKEIVILQDLEGYSRREVAKKLGLPPGTVASQLDRGRKLLRDRLVRRGVTLGAGGLAAVIAQCAAAENVLPTALIQETLRHVELFLLAGTNVSGTAAVAKITSLAQGELNTMFLKKLSTTVGILALVAALVLAALPGAETIGVISQVRAAQFFTEDFEDGNVFDNMPVRWRQEGPPLNKGIVETQNGDLLITPPDSIPNYPFVEVDVLVDGLAFDDVSLRTRLRVLGTGAFAAGFLGRHTYDPQNGLLGTTMFAAIREGGRLVIGVSQNNQVNIELTSVASGLNPALYDVNMQLDLRGRRAALTAWREGTMMPSAPQLIVENLPSFVANAGAVGLLNAQSLQQNPKFPVAFRYFHVVPEPSSAAISVLGAVALASFAFRSRLLRVNR
jgi:RNA polymerase sigma factor (sigma-70 family)